MKPIKIINLKQTCYAFPSQWDFLTDDNRIGYVRYRWGVLTVQITVPFNILVKHTSIAKIISNTYFHMDYCNLKFPKFKFIKSVIKNIWKYKIIPKTHNVLKSLNDIPEIFEFSAVDGIYILNEILDPEQLDGIIKWSAVWDKLKNIDYKRFTGENEEKFLINKIKEERRIHKLNKKRRKIK